LNDNIWKRNEIESPCVKLCVVHPEHKICIGCFRTISEISGWSHLTAENRKQIIKTLKTREALLEPKRRGGRSQRIKS
tara:strand:- start:660 stop:893 length:234 start_codon:yes stop_codon:yes gene_type:complete